MQTALDQSTIQTLSVSGENVFYVDGLMLPEEVEHFSKVASSLSFRRAERSHDGDEYSSFSTDFQVEQFSSKVKIGRVSDELINNLYPHSGYELYRAYINMSHYGDVEYPHTDCAPDDDDITVLYYAHHQWNRDWGGETFFYQGQNVVAAISPIPGRFLIFPGAIDHVGSVPTRICKTPRFSLAMKYKAKNKPVMNLN